MRTNNLIENAKSVHKVYHQFQNWLAKTYGKDLYSKWIVNTVTLSDGTKKKLRYRNFNEYELNKRLVGYEVIENIERYIKRYCKEIKIIRCDDSYYSGSILLLIPHINHGVTVMFIPQCTTIQNRFFLYGEDYKELINGLEKMKYVYKKGEI
mgnify:CR=1 FL=1